MTRNFKLPRKALLAGLRVGGFVGVACIALWLLLSNDNGEADVLPWQALKGVGGFLADDQQAESTSTPSNVAAPQFRTQVPEMFGLSAGMLGPGDAEAFFTPDPEDDAVPFEPSDPSMRVAICLTGEARDFQLTGPSIIFNLLPAYPNPHLFLHAPLEEKAYRFLSLAWSPPSVVIGAIRIFPLDSMDERKCLHGMVSNKWTPSCQAILQQFRLIQGCLSLIGTYEAAHSFRFNWIVRTRADNFWSMPPPPLKDMPLNAHVFPYGSDCGGINDRLAMGRWKTSRIAMSRLALLPHIYAQNKSLQGLNPETVLSTELAFFNTPIGRAHFWFCVVSRKFYPIFGMPIPSMASGYKVPLNGAKCRPCVPYKVGEEANKTLETFDPLLRPPVTEGLELCNASSVWQDEWESTFDATVGTELANMRKKIDLTDQKECVSTFRLLQQKTWNWDAPTPEVLCLRRTLGGAVLLGNPGESFFCFLDFVSKHPKSLGGPQQVKVIVHADESFRFSFNATEVFLPMPPSNSSWLAALTDKLENKGVTVRSELIPATGGMNSGEVADIYLVAVQDVQLVKVVNSWSMNRSAPKACQLLMSFHSGHEAPAKKLRLEVSKVLKHLQFQISSCIQEPHDDVERCTYFSLEHCL